MGLINFIRTKNYTDSQIENIIGKKSGQWKSGNATAFSDLYADMILPDAEKLDLNMVTIPVLVKADDIGDSEPYIDEHSWDLAKQAAIAVKSKGYKIIMEPFPMVANGSIGETEWNPENMATFFEYWGNALKEIAAFCELRGLEGMYIASNLVHMENSFSEWSTLISDLKRIYKGNLIYRTNWWYQNAQLEEKLANNLFSLVDIIAIAAYFEVSDDPSPSKRVLKESLYNTTVWNRGQNIVSDIETLSKKWNKPIFLGELGIAPYDGAPAKPWSYHFDEDGYNENVQSNWFDAWFEVFKDFDWFLGYSIYNIADRHSTFDVIGRRAASHIRDQVYSGGGKLDDLERELNSMMNEISDIRRLLDELTSVGKP
ncbi:hypothetical protein BEP19_14795 [Ammoniphilus oxalaticus]|uniref:Hydrolase n=1 Tax=Ammoniphilus oxalaticus TaxID=66863 RepID=A0A419SE96_9BACL|nr:hypothetical protein [Ammoniphilus oxalaticus]RKD21486.1 hypothetical protein BEP19_14795 [Ammoniphilus oxalaticus]